MRAAQMQTAAISVAARKTGIHATSQTTPTPATSTRCAGPMKTVEKGAEDAIIIQGASGGTNPRSAPAHAAQMQTVAISVAAR